MVACISWREALLLGCHGRRDISLEKAVVLSAADLHDDLLGKWEVLDHDWPVDTLLEVNVAVG